MRFCDIKGRNNNFFFCRVRRPRATAVFFVSSGLERCKNKCTHCTSNIISSPRNHHFTVLTAAWPNSPRCWATFQDQVTFFFFHQRFMVRTHPSVVLHHCGYGFVLIFAPFQIQRGENQGISIMLDWMKFEKSENHIQRKETGECHGKPRFKFLVFFFFSPAKTLLETALWKRYVEKKRRKKYN